MSKITPTITPATTPPRTAGLSFFGCAVSETEDTPDVAVGLGTLELLEVGEGVTVGGVEEEDVGAERQLEFWPVCTKNGGDCEKKPAVCEVSNATAT